MRNKNSIILVVFATLCLIALSSQAGTPLWTFTPLTATTISVSPTGTAIVKYQVTNQSGRMRLLAMNPITGVTQITSGSGVCTHPFRLSSHSACTLSLQINGSEVQTGNTNGPEVCEQGGSLQCYRPSAADILNINKIANQYSIGGAIAGLSNTVYLQNNGIDVTAFNNNG
ncbi:MAG: hypothetical protein JO149_08805, partial [Gammaproteobacteria bacterium]|nr:hypothetical protein [Gammaproteobacteria bacterium]